MIVGSDMVELMQTTYNIHIMFNIMFGSDDVEHDEHHVRTSCLVQMMLNIMLSIMFGSDDVDYDTHIVALPEPNMITTT